MIRQVFLNTKLFSRRMPYGKVSLQSGQGSQPSLIAKPTVAQFELNLTSSPMINMRKTG